jgi:hypothetical protein
MPDWSEQPDKILCRCGVVSWTPTVSEGDPPKYTLRDACPGCGRKDNVDEIGSLQKMSPKKAAATIGAVCDLLEIEPLQALNGRTMIQVKDLAQHLEDLGRPLAAERLRKGWDALKAGMLKGAKELFPGLSPTKPSNGPTTAFVTAVPTPPRPQQPIMMVPGCAQCGEAVRDYKPSYRGTVDGFLCSRCRGTVEKTALIPLLEAEIAKSQMAADSILAAAAGLKEQLTALTKTRLVNGD